MRPRRLGGALAQRALFARRRSVIGGPYGKVVLLDRGGGRLVGSRERNAVRGGLGRLDGRSGLGSTQRRGFECRLELRRACSSFVVGLDGRLNRGVSHGGLLLKTSRSTNRLRWGRHRLLRLVFCVLRMHLLVVGHYRAVGVGGVRLHLGLVGGCIGARLFEPGAHTALIVGVDWIALAFRRYRV